MRFVIRVLRLPLVLSFFAVPQAQILHTLVSPNAGEDGHFGFTVAGAGDVNADGVHDVLVGAPDEWWCPPGGRAYVFDGANGRLVHELYSYVVEPWAGFGWSVSGAGDVNNDGHDDVVVGAPRDHDLWSGRAIVFGGESGEVIHEFDLPDPVGYEMVGWSVSGASDLNGDGHDDVIVGAIGDWYCTGTVYVFSGQTGSCFLGWHSPNPGYGGGFGWAACGGGDVNNDGVNDVTVGAPLEDPGSSPPDAGRAYVFGGATGTLLWTLSSPAEEDSGMFGHSVSHTGDVDADGWGDVIVGVPYEDGASGAPDAGRAYVFSGQSGNVLYALTSPMELASGRFGWSVSGAGDANRDGCPDMLVGAPGEDPGSGAAGSGAAYVFSGKTGELLHVLCSVASVTGGEFGSSVSDVGDLDGDGLGEVVVGAPGEPGLYPAGAGRAYVFTFPPTMPLTGVLVSGALQLHWFGYPAAGEYWVYGADNDAHFEPGLVAPYQHRLATLPAGTMTWSSTAGVGDPGHNWTYEVIAVNASGEAMCISDRFAEHDFDTVTNP